MDVCNCIGREEMGNNPFLVETDKTLVALCGVRNGYILLATSEVIESYADWQETVFNAAKAWSAALDSLGSPRVYWIMFSEETRHLHMHLFPRWESDTLKSTSLFETRHSPGQPAWTHEVKEALRDWADEFHVEILKS
jgi:diadenosine tetraphosphate (Ap4A) HIT family hydrolase